MAKKRNIILIYMSVMNNKTFHLLPYGCITLDINNEKIPIFQEILMVII